jgi:HEAT repeat protein
MSLFGAPDVLGLEARRDVKGLAGALRYKSGNAGVECQVVRAAAAEALSRIGDERAVESLIAALRDQDGSSVHRGAAEALGRIGDARGVGPLVAVLVGIDSDSSVREAAVIALGKIGDASAVPPLIVALKDEIARVREAAAAALGEIGDAGAVEALTANFADTDKEVRRSIATALGKLGDARAVGPLIAAFEDPIGDVREAAADAVDRLGYCAIEPLTAALQAPNRQTRAAVAKVLVGVLTSGRPAEVGVPSGAVESLVECLGSRDAALRESAARLLGKIGDDSAIEALVRALSSDSLDMVKAAAEALGMLRWQPDRSAAGAAYWASQARFDRCLEIGAVATPSLVAALKDRHQAARDAAAQALVEVGAQAFDSLIGALSDGAKTVRSTAAWVLGEIGDVRAVEPLIASLADGVEDVRVAARRALVRIGAPAVESLIAALRGSRDWEVYMCEMSAQALVDIGAPAVEPLIAAVGDEDVLVRWTAVEALGKIGDKRAVASLVSALDDRAVRQAASEALDLLGWKPDMPETGIEYPFTVGGWVRAAETGTPAAKPLVAVFEDRFDDGRPDMNTPAPEPFVPAFDD